MFRRCWSVLAMWNPGPRPTISLQTALLNLFQSPMRQGSRIVRFGVFEADLDAVELRKHGLKIRLPEQGFQILAMLAERPGEIITRAELRERLWPGRAYVDFERGLNK